MAIPLLQTKLYTPHPRPSLVPRPRLLDKLDCVLERKLTLISAPAGFGKTTLLSEWIENQDLRRRQQEQTPPRIAWLSLDTNDNNPARFLFYFVHALQNLGVLSTDEFLPVFQDFQISSIKEIWEFLASQIAACPGQILLIFDDYHVIESTTIHEGIAFMLEQMPPCMHLVITSRVDPPLPLSRLRVRDELVELRADDLRFSSEETTAFLDLWIGEKLSTADREELEARTEGWVAGLQLAALALQNLAEKKVGNEESLSAFVQRLSGSSRFVMDYLVEEVLQRLPEDWRSFLLQTSFLEQLTAPLCDAVTQRHDSQSILDSLEKANLFLFPLDDQRVWYRYHHLFAELLRSIMQAEQPARTSDLHYRASEWYESRNMVTEAIQHALKVPDVDEAARLMEKVALETVRRGDVMTLQSWSALIPREQARHRPILCVCFAISFELSAKLEVAEEYLSLIDPSTATPDIQSHIITANSMHAFYTGDYERAIQYHRLEVEQPTVEDTALKGVLALSSGAAYEMIGDDEAAYQSLQEGKQLSHAIGNRTTELRIIKKLGDLQVRRGQLHTGALSYHQALRMGSIGEKGYLPVAAHAVAAIGQVLYEWNQLEEAERYLLKGIEASRKLENSFGVMSNLQCLARICWIRGDRESAKKLREETEQVMLEFPPLPSFAAQESLQQVRMYLRMGETMAAARWAQVHGQSWKSGHAYQMELMAILWSRIRIAQEIGMEAIEILEHALPPARESGRWGVVIELLLLQALALESEHQTTSAVASLEEALRLAEPEGYTRIFLDEGEPMARLLRNIYRSKEKGTRDYEARLLEGLLAPEETIPPLAVHQASTGKRAESPILIEPLSERELEVLRMIIEGRSNQEIAEKLVITLGTVKAHVSNIYGKLDVRSRTQAIIKAGELGLTR